MRVIFLLFIFFVMASAYRVRERTQRLARVNRHDSRDINRYHKDMNMDRDDDYYGDTVDDSDDVADDDSAQDAYDDSGEYSDEESDEDEGVYYEPLPRQQINRRRLSSPHFVRCFGPPSPLPLKSNGRPRPIR